MNNIAWLRTMMKSGRVTRYHNTPMLTRQTIADHTWGVCICLLWLTDGQATSAMMKAALYHDAPEIMTGDVPAPVKVDNKHLTDALTVIEETFIQDMQLDIELPQDQWRLISIADTMELLLHCNKEIHMGNGYADNIFEKGAVYFVNKVHQFDDAQEWKLPIMERLHLFAHDMGIGL